MAIYEAGDVSAPTETLMLAEVPIGFEQATGQKLSPALRMKLIGSLGDPLPLRDLPATNLQIREMSIRGRKVRAEYVRGAERGEGDIYQQATLVFPGRSPGTTGLLVIQLPERTGDQAELESILQSIEYHAGVP